MSLRYLSLCSGIEAATQAWHPLGWKPVAFSEIEAFPCAVLAHHYPAVPNWGDMTRFQEWPDAVVDVLCGGTPCQSFSVAGLRQGLADPRGNLMLTFGAVAARYRPRWLVWENVPGVLSSNGGRDFGTFLGMLGQLGYGVAYRVLDAQHVRTCRFPRAVPQRRRRVFVVGYLGDWRRAAAVLFDRESLSGHPPPRRKAGQGIAPTLASRPSGGGGLGTDFELDGGLIANSGDVSYCLTASAQQSLDAETETLLAVAHSQRGNGFDASEDGNGRGTPIIAIQERAVSENPEAGPDGVGCNTEGAAYTLKARQQVQAVAFAKNQRGELRTSEVALQLTTGGGKPGEGYPAVAFGLSTQQEPKWAEGVSPTLALPSKTGGGQTTAVAFSVKDHGGDAMVDCSPTLRAGGHDGSHQNGGVMPAVAQPWAVRRLLPVECEALQGFPRDFTRIPYRGKPADQCPDGPRYKALGNSWAVNCAEWIGERIAEVDRW
jgi:DNA (cytosine-5)-methyltransferase 1